MPDVSTRNAEAAASYKRQSLLEIPRGRLSLAPWLPSYHSSFETIPIIHPLFQHRPLLDTQAPAIPIPLNWLGGYWDQINGRVPTLADLKDALKGSEATELGGPDKWFPPAWSLRSMASPAILCPTLHPVNANRIPVLKQVSCSVLLILLSSFPGEILFLRLGRLVVTYIFH